MTNMATLGEAVIRKYPGYSANDLRDRAKDKAMKRRRRKYVKKDRKLP